MAAAFRHPSGLPHKMARALVLKRAACVPVCRAKRPVTRLMSTPPNISASFASPNNFVPPQLILPAAFCAAQLAFLDRKRRFALGELDTPFPDTTVCASCSGVGTLICRQCKGTGVNEGDITEIMGAESLEAIIPRNGVINPLYYFIKGGPCWICKGQPNVGCGDCSGSGRADFLRNYTDD